MLQHLLILEDRQKAGGGSPKVPWWVASSPLPMVQRRGQATRLCLTAALALEGVRTCLR